MEGNSTGETFAQYLAKVYVGKRGYRLGALPEAAALEAGCDIVLTFSDGLTLDIIAIVDREAHPGKTFTMARRELKEIGKNCLRYTGRVSGAKMAVGLRIFEIGPSSSDDRKRLRQIQQYGGFSKVVISAWILDPATASIWSSAPFGGALAGRGKLRALMEAPRADEAELQPASPPAMRPKSFPIVTYGLLAILAGVFALEQILGIGPSTRLLTPSIATLVGMGGSNASLVIENGEWFRLFTAALLHADPIHVAANGIALWLVGRILERWVGPAWFAALFALGAVGGSLTSIAVNTPQVISVGASGAITCLFAAAFVCSWRLPADGGRSHAQVVLGQTLIPALIPLATSGHSVDFAAHLGGALTGLVLGIVVFKSWSRTIPEPPFRKLATTVALAGLLAFGGSGYLATGGYRVMELSSHLMSAKQLPKTDAEAKGNSQDLVARFPRDPRSHWFRALALLDAKDVIGAEAELRSALVEREVLTTILRPQMEQNIRAALASLVAAKGDLVQAKDLARPVCLLPPEDQVRRTLGRQRICE